MSVRVLVVDDSPTFRVPLKATLTAAGFTVFVAESAEAAEQTMELEPVDVVLSDVGLPGMDGLELAERHPETPFVLMTGSAAARATVPASVRAWLTKPLEMSNLLLILHSTMKGRAHASI